MKYIPWIYRMRVLWVGGCGLPKTSNVEYEENIWILKLWGNPRWKACESAMFRKRLFGVPKHLHRYNCVAAWYNPINWKSLIDDLKFKFKNVGI